MKHKTKHNKTLKTNKHTNKKLTLPYFSLISFRAPMNPDIDDCGMCLYVHCHIWSTFTSKR